MRRIFITALTVISLAACGETIENQEGNKVDFGEVGPLLELEYNNGQYVPKSKPVSQEVFSADFKGAWRLEKIMSVSKTGKLTSEEKLPGLIYPLFAVKEEGKIRQYIHDSSIPENRYKDGTYSYDPTTGILHFIDVVDNHPEFRIVTLKETEMTGTFADKYNNSESSVLTLYVYSRLSPLDEMDLDQEYGVVF